MATPAEILAAGGLANTDLIVQAASATGVPLAMASSMTFPKVSLSEGNTNTSQLA